MKIIDSFNPSTAISGDIQTQGVNSNEQLMLFNDSIYGLKLTFSDGSIDIIPPAWNRDFIIKNVAMGKVHWERYTQLNVVGYPNSLITGTLYEDGEHVNNANASMQRGFVATGGNVGVSDVIASQVSDTSHNFGFQTYASRVSGDSDDSIKFFNNGNAQFGNSAIARNASVKVDNGSVITFPEGSPSFTKRMTVDNNDNSLMFDFGNSLTGKLLKLSSGNINNGSILFDLARGIIASTIQGKSISGSGGGTATLYEILTGSVKLALLITNAFKNSGAGAQTLAFDSPYTIGARIWTGALPPLQLLNSGSAQNLGIITGLASTGGSRTVQTQLNGYSIADTLSPFDTISFIGSQSTANGGVHVFIGG